MGTDTDQRNREEEIERLAREVGRLIGEADPDTREELREAATALMREEARDMPMPPPTAPEQARRAANPMAAGLGLLIIGGGLTFVMPPVGIALLVLGAAAIVWGGVMSAMRK